MLSPLPRSMPTAPSDPETLLALEIAAHDRWNPVWQWLLVGLLFVCFIFNILRPLLFTGFRLQGRIPKSCFTWIVPREHRHEATGEKERRASEDGWVNIPEYALSHG
ncbi:hypothetical protein PMIN02_002822 [Paraphaeosphaeria minitans]